ncbi:MAG TPA: hypothetical protein VF062_24780 [Candidatus Limnocylindrales bacterium]
MSQPGIRIFLDRSIGTKSIAAALRSLALDVETIKDRYGEEASTVADVRWIEEATADGRVLISADQRIRYNPLERRAICRHAARCFTFPRGSLTAAEMIGRLETHVEEIARLAQQPGPYVYHLTEHRVVRMKLDCDDIIE